MKIAFVIPVYNERDTLPALVEGIEEHASEHEFRILFINDGSTDGSTEVLNELHEAHEAVDVIHFRRNFGKSAALASGFAHADSDVIITMDADLQDDPKEIPRFIEALEEGKDVVVGWKEKRHDPWHKTVPSGFYNRGITRLFGVDLHDINCGFKALRREVVKLIPLYGEMHRLIPVLASELGFSVAEIPVQHHPRRFGQSKYGLERFTRGAMDVATVFFLTVYRNRPGHFFGHIAVGLGALGAAALLGALVAVGAGKPLASLILLLMVIVSGAAGAAMLGLGLVAELLLRQHISRDPAAYVREERVH